MNNDLISRQAILKHIEKIRQGLQMMDNTHRTSIIMNGMHLCEEAVRNQPSAQPDVPEIKVGKWIGGDIGYCTCCGHKGCASDIWNGCKKLYCPNCGAMMEE